MCVGFDDGTVGTGFASVVVDVAVVVAVVVAGLLRNIGFIWMLRNFGLIWIVAGVFGCIFVDYGSKNTTAKSDIHIKER